jgi:hypothetical protein
VPLSARAVAISGHRGHCSAPADNPVVDTELEQQDCTVEQILSEKVAPVAERPARLGHVECQRLLDLV